MRKISKKIILPALVFVMAFFAVGLLMTPPDTFAAKAGDVCDCPDGSRGTVTVDTAILSACDCGAKGGAITNTLNTVVEIMTIGIGILGVLGITIVGIQYLTAGGSEEKTRKAKRRMFEIIIGLVAYVLIYALLKWLVPGFSPFS